MERAAVSRPIWLSEVRLYQASVFFKLNESVDLLHLLAEFISGITGSSWPPLKGFFPPRAVFIQTSLLPGDADQSQPVLPPIISQLPFGFHLL